MIQLEGIFGLKLKQLKHLLKYIEMPFTDTSLICFKTMLPIKVVYLKSIIIVNFFYHILLI